MSRNRRCWPSRATPCWRCCSRRRSRANISSTSRPVWPSTRPPSRRLPVRLTSQKLEQKSDVDSLNLPRLRWRRRSAGDVHVEAPVDGRPASSATRVPLLLFRPGNPHPPKTNQRIFFNNFLRRRRQVDAAPTPDTEASVRIPLASLEASPEAVESALPAQPQTVP